MSNHMSVATAIETRRAIKGFDPEHRMSQAEIDRLMSLAMLAPTAFNIQNWRFVLVQDPELGPGAGNGCLAAGGTGGRSQILGKAAGTLLGQCCPTGARLSAGGD